MLRRSIIEPAAGSHLAVVNERSSAKARAGLRRETMKTIIRAAMFAVSIGSITPAFAVPPAQHQNAEARPDRQLVLAYATQSGRGAYLFPPHDGGGANS